MKSNVTYPQPPSNTSLSLNTTFFFPTCDTPPPANNFPLSSTSARPSPAFGPPGEPGPLPAGPLPSLPRAPRPAATAGGVALYPSPGLLPPLPAGGKTATGPGEALRPTPPLLRGAKRPGEVGETGDNGLGPRAAFPGACCTARAADPRP